MIFRNKEIILIVNREEIYNKDNNIYQINSIQINELIKFKNKLLIYDNKLLNNKIIFENKMIFQLKLI